MNTILKNVAWLDLSLTWIFIILKLFDKIDWSWWWVLSPIWIGLAIGALIAIVGMIAFVFKDQK